MRAQTCQQRPARPEAALYRVLSGLPRAKFRPRPGYGEQRECKFFRPALSHLEPFARLGRRRFQMQRSYSGNPRDPRPRERPDDAGRRAVLVRQCPRRDRYRAVQPAFRPRHRRGVSSPLACALAARAWRPRYWPAAVAGAGFLAAHALIHLVMIVGGHSHHVGFDLLVIVLPAALALYSAFPTQGEHHA